MGFTTLVLTVDSVAVLHNQLHGNIEILRRENEASTMDVTLITPIGVQNIDSWAGKPITLDVDGVRTFTGVIDMPEIDLIGKKITLACSDKRKEILNAQNVSSVGFYSLAVFNEAENTIDELTQRLQTIPSAADIKPDGTYAITDIRPKTVADITLTNSDVYRRKPSVSPTSRANLINQVDLNFQFRYTRLRHRERSFQIGNNTFCDYAETTGSIYTKKTEFLSYIDMMDWHANESSIVFEDLPASGIITSCNMPSFILYNWNNQFAIKVNYDAAIRFTQTVTEDYTITIKAPQSISQYGLINWSQNNGQSIDYDAAAWEANKTYVPPTGLTNDPNDYYLDMDDATEYSDAVLTAINIAATKIIRSHRDTQVNFETDLRTDFDLTKTISLTTDIVNAQGKISSIKHSIDLTNRWASTETEISLSTAQGTQVADSLTAPVRPTIPVVADAFTDPLIMPLSLYNTGNIETPAVDDTSRNEQTVSSNVTYNLEIQNDTFQVTF